MPARTPRERLRILLICLGLALATCATFEQVRLNGFVSYDDGEYVTENEHVTAGLTRESVSWAITATRMRSWTPATWLSHMLDVELYGLDPAGHHLTNVLLHLLNALLLFGLLERMTGSVWRSGLVAALFALHPLRVEPVAWASERKEVLSSCFGLLSLWAYVGYARRGGLGRYLLTALLFALALMSKPMLVTLPMVFLLLDYWPLDRIHLGSAARRAAADARRGRALDEPTCPPRSLARLLIEKTPLLALSAGISAVTVSAQSVSGMITTVVPLELRAANAVVAYTRYVGKLVWPVDLAVLYTHPNLPGGTPWSGWQVATAALLLLAISTWVVRATRLRYALVGWLWYLGTLVPVIGMLPPGRQTAMADRYAYFPLIGLFVIVAWGGADLVARWPWRGFLLRRIAVLGAVAVLALCSVLSWRLVRTGHDSVSLYEHALTVSPTDPTLHYNLAIVLRGQGRTAEAIGHYRRMLDAEPDAFGGHNNLANALRSEGRVDEAIVHYRAALQINPYLAEAHYNLGNTLAARGSREEAIRHYRGALEADPGYAAAHNNLGSLLRSGGDLDEGLRHYREAVRADPDYALAHLNLASALHARGELEEAIAHYREALRVDPHNGHARQGLSAATQELGSRESAPAGASP